MDDEDYILNRLSIADQRRTHALRGSLLRAIFRHRLWMWVERLKGARTA